MSKKNNDNFVPKIEIPEGTLTESFVKFIERDESVKNILQFLSVKNAQYLAKYGLNKEFTKEEKEELYEFYSYFMENYGEETEKARYANWGTEAFVFRLADSLYIEDWKANEEFARTVPEAVMGEAKNLADKVFAIRKDKFFSCMADNDTFTFSLNGTIPKKYLQEAKRYVSSYIAKIIIKKGIMVVRIFTNERNQMFGIVGTGSTWEPVSKEKMRKSDLQAQKDDNIYEPMEYIEIER